MDGVAHRARLREADRKKKRQSENERTIDHGLWTTNDGQEMLDKS